MIVLWLPVWLVAGVLALCLVLACTETGGARRVEPPPPRPSAGLVMRALYGLAAFYIAGLVVLCLVLKLTGRIP